MTGADDLLSLPYRDRQLIAVVLQLDAPSNVEEVEIQLRDYINVRNVENLFKKSYWTDTKNWGLTGYLVDKARGTMASVGSASASEGNTVRHLRKIRADLAERILSFPPGHPLYGTAYAGHPLKREVYTPLASFHRVLFEEKFNELLTLLWCLGATNVSIHYVRGYRDAFGANAEVSLPADVPIKLGASAERQTGHNSEATLEAHFTPTGQPRVPDSTTWYPYERTWQKVAEARLSAGLKSIDLELRYDDDFGVSGEVAAGLSGVGFKLGGAFQKHERTRWRFHCSFG